MELRASGGHDVSCLEKENACKKSSHRCAATKVGNWQRQRQAGEGLGSTAKHCVEKKAMHMQATRHSMLSKPLEKEKKEKKDKKKMRNNIVQI